MQSRYSYVHSIYSVSTALPIPLVVLLIYAILPEEQVSKQCYGVTYDQRSMDPLHLTTHSEPLG